jgi:hypothetical protein
MSFSEGGAITFRQEANIHAPRRDAVGVRERQDAVW